MGAALLSAAQKLCCAPRSLARRRLARATRNHHRRAHFAAAPPLRRCALDARSADKKNAKLPCFRSLVYQRSNPINPKALRIEPRSSAQRSPSPHHNTPVRLFLQERNQPTRAASSFFFADFVHDFALRVYVIHTTAAAFGTVPRPTEMGLDHQLFRTLLLTCKKLRNAQPFSEADIE